MELPVRKRIRLENYDYSRCGAYFITVCTRDKMCIFWDNNDKYRSLTADHNDIIPQTQNAAETNHNDSHDSPNVHDFPNVGAAFRRPCVPKKVRLSNYGRIVKTELNKIPTVYPDIVFISKYVIMPNHIHLIVIINGDLNGGRRDAAPTISRIMNQFKGQVSRKSGFSVWQRSFYDRIIRDDDEYRAFWEYIERNPYEWENDELFREE